MKSRLILVLIAAAISNACSELSAPADIDEARVVLDLMSQVDIDNASFIAPSLPNLPDDLQMHPQSRAEVLSLQAILTIGDDALPTSASDQAGLMVHMERIALTSEARPDDSDWRYNGVMRSRVAIDASVGNIDPTDAIYNESTASRAQTLFADLPVRQSIQRMALDLAGANDSGLWVGGDSVQLTLTTSVQGSCERSYQWTSALSARDTITLGFVLKDCPDVQRLGELNTWQHSGVVLSGQLVSTMPDNSQTATALAGVGWMRRSYGNPPPSGMAAVLIDALQLRLADGRLLGITRSKRRTGRGPRTVTASLREPGGRWQNIALNWEDSDEQLKAASGNSYPASIRVTSVDASIDVQIAPMNRLIESAEPSGMQLSVPVTVQGTHQGAGFISYVAMPPAP